MGKILDNQRAWLELASSRHDARRIILHIHRNPSTGVWAIMKNLIREQNKIPGVLSILAIPADSDWMRSNYCDELQTLDLPYIVSLVPKLFGTGAFFLSILVNPLRRWLKHIRHAYPETEIIVHSHSAWLTGGYLPLPKVDKFGLIATFHGIADDNRLRNIWWLGVAHRFLAQRLFQSGAILSSVSRETAWRAEEIFQIPQNTFAVIPNGMTFPESSGKKNRVKQQRLVVGHVGQMHPGKGWRLLLEAVDQLHQEGLDIRLLLAGAGEDADLANQEASKRKEYVQFLGLVQNAGERLIPQLDVLVLATWSEGMPMSIIEAFAAGVPVIATAVGGIPEMVEDEVNGILIERNSTAIAQALRKYFFDPNLVLRLRNGALKTFSEKFEISQVVRRYSSLYDLAINSDFGRKGR
jgi:glycosyltransferase involved in cell wall biosynthesis